MSRRLPQNLNEFQDFSRFTFDLWNSLDNYYGFHIDRWRRTLDFLRAQHWRTLQQYSRESLPDWRRFPVIEYSLAFYSDYLSQFLQSDVRFSAIPASPDPEDIASAELVEQVDKYLWDKLGFDRKRVDLGAWLMSTGTAALRIFWNTNTGNLIPFGLPQPDGSVTFLDPETMEPTDKEVLVDEGEIGVEVISPQFVRWAPNPAHGVMVGLMLSYDEVLETWGKRAAEGLSYSSSHQGIASDLTMIQQPSGVQPTDDRALVIQHYVPRSTRYPGGVWWTASKNGRLLTRPYPLPAKEIPVVGFRWIPVPGERNLGLSPLYGVTFSNKMYDEIVARIIEWHNKVLPKVLLKSGGGLTYGDINDEPGQELIVNPGAEPEFMESRQPPRTFFEALNLAEKDMFTVGGYQFQREKDLPEGLATNRVRQPPVFKEGNETSLALINSKVGWERVGRLLPGYVAAFWTEPRVIALQGPDRNYQWKEFTGSIDLADISATIKVDEVPLYPWNRQSLRDTVIAVLDTQLGELLFADPQTGGPNMDRLQAALQATGLDVSIPSLDPDVLEARNEIVEFENLEEGQPPPDLSPWQNNEVHIEEKTRVMKSMRFRAWSPHAQEALLQNVSQHEEVINEAAQEEAQAMIEQERSLRQVREDAQLSREVRTMLAEKILDALGVPLEDLLKSVATEEEESE